MFKKALSQLQLEDSELAVNEVTLLLQNHLGKQDSGWSAWDFGQVVKGLGSYSLIEYDHQTHTYSIHPTGTTLERHYHGGKK